jgi:CBS domain-containing protein
LLQREMKFRFISSQNPMGVAQRRASLTRRSPLITIGPDATAREAMDLMAGKDIRRLFVVDKGR